MVTVSISTSPTTPVTKYAIESEKTPLWSVTTFYILSTIGTVFGFVVIVTLLVRRQQRSAPRLSGLPVFYSKNMNQFSERSSHSKYEHSEYEHSENIRY